MRKKYLMIGMAMIMGLSLIACDQDTKGTTENKTQTKTEENITSDKEDNTEEDDVQVSTDEKEIEGLHLKVKTNNYVSDEGSADVYGSYQIARVDSDGYDSLQKAIDEWFSNYERNYEEKVKELAKLAEEDKEFLGEDFYGYSQNETLKVQRLDEKIVSIAITENSYTGGVHGNWVTYGITFDVETGEEITFEQLGDVKEDVKTYIDAYIEEKRNEGFVYQNYEDMIDSLLESPKWYLTGEGLEIAFDPYEIASYAEGSTFVIIPYEEMKNFNKDLLSEEDMMIQAIDLNEKHEIDIDLDGEKETIQFLSTETDDFMLDLEIQLNDEKLKLDIASRPEISYYVRTKDKKSYLLISYDLMSDDYVTCLIDITDKQIKLLETMDDSRILSVSSQMVEIEQGIDALGSYRGNRDFDFTNGKFEAVGDRYIIQQYYVNNPQYGITLTQDLKVSIRENEKMVEKTLEKGTVLHIVDFNNEDTLGFSLEDGTYGEIKYTKEEHEIIIDGKTGTEIFENLPYAG